MSETVSALIAMLTACAWIFLLVETLPEAQSFTGGLVLFTLDTCLVLIAGGILAWVVDFGRILGEVCEALERRYLRKP